MDSTHDPRSDPVPQVFPGPHPDMAEAAGLPRPDIAGARRIVFKLGTRVLTRDDGTLARDLLGTLTGVATRLRRQGRDVLLVSSGAVGLGKEALGLAHPPVEVDDRQACAAVGQSRLMRLYEEAFSREGLLCAQLLLTEVDFDVRDRYLNLRAALHALLHHGVIPVINENDAVSTAELAYTTGGPRPIFGDNDRLSALVASKLGADLLVLFTDVPGVFDRDPRKHPEARLIHRVDPELRLDAALGGVGTTAGTGGMQTKVAAARIAAASGCHAVVASGREPHRLDELLAGGEVGTWFPARDRPHARQRWIAHAAAPRGVLSLDAGAVEALTLRSASLLAAGVVAVEGEFRAGDVVELRGPDGDTVGRGVVAWDADTVRAWSTGDRPAGVRNAHAVIRRDEIVLNGGVS